MKAAPKKRTVAKMDAANRAMCYALRNQPRGQKPSTFKSIQLLVRKKDGRRPSIAAICKAATTFLDDKGQRGRLSGSNKTTKKEDKDIVSTFLKVRPPGHGVDSRVVHKALPQKLQKKVSRRTIIRRLAAKGYTPQKKLNKSDPGHSQKLKRTAFCRKHKDKNYQRWQSHLQAVGDFKEFTWYPKELQSKFQKLRAPWTYMTAKEKKKGPFLRPKRWFPKKDWKKTKKQKVFGLTTSNGKSLVFVVPKPFSAEQWAVLVKKRVAPFLKKSFPRLQSFNILLDGEGLLHAPAAKAAYRKANMSTEPGWPKYSPDLNPQENVWAWAESRLRELETGADTFEQWQGKVLRAVSDYPSSSKLVGSMAKRCKTVLDRSGAMNDS
jgi:transposase